MANNLIMQAAGIPTSGKRHMTIIHYGIKTGHACFHQHSCDTVKTLKPIITIVTIIVVVVRADGGAGSYCTDMP